MASSVTLVEITQSGNKYRTHGTMNLGTYAAGGVAITARNLGLSVIEVLNITGAGGYVFEFDRSNLKIKAYEAGADSAALDEVGSTDISAAEAEWEASGV